MQKYSKAWPQIREAILERAGHRCEGCRTYPDCRAVEGEPHPVTGTVVVLQVAHDHRAPQSLPHTERASALCARCHLATDRPLHKWQARKNRAARQRRLQPLLFDPQKGEEVANSEANLPERERF